MKIIEAQNVQKQFGYKKAIDQLNLTVDENKIIGLIGRNGVGKTTLLKMMAGFSRPTAGSLRVFNEAPYQSLQVSAQTIFMSDDVTFLPTQTLRDILQSGRTFYPNWNQNLAHKLLDYFQIPLKTYHDKLSKGMKSTFNLIFALATRSPLTLLDEPTTGMDAAVRKDVYRVVLKEYLESPRTIILSSHLLEEIEELLEEVILMDQGTIKLHQNLEDLREYAVFVTANTADISELKKAESSIYEQTMGLNQQQAAFRATHELIQRANELGLATSPVPVSDLCLYLTAHSKGGIDDVLRKND